MARLKRVSRPSVSEVFNSTKMSKSELATHLTELGQSATTDQRRKAMTQVCIDFDFPNEYLEALSKKSEVEIQTLGNVCILLTKGHNLSDLYEEGVIKQKLETFLKGTSPGKTTEPPPKVVKIRTISSSLSEWLNTLDFLVDEFTGNSKQTQVNIPPVPTLDRFDQNYLKAKEVPIWSEEVSRLSDEECLEGYSNFSKRRQVALKKFYETLLAMVSLETQAKPTKKKRTRSVKAKPVEKQLEKLVFNEEKSKVKKKDILSATEIWAFNEKYNDLIHWVAEDGTKFTVKGTTLQNVDLIKSQLKRVRPNKQAATLAEIAKANKNRCGMIFTSLPTKIDTPSPRLSNSIILLQVF